MTTGLRCRSTALWQFRIDPNDEGASAGWFSADVPFPETIRVPGNWQAQGFGEPRNHLSHDYQGKAWYRRTVTFPRTGPASESGSTWAE